jgi:hypothetical protein
MMRDLSLRGALYATKQSLFLARRDMRILLAVGLISVWVNGSVSAQIPLAPVVALGPDSTLLPLMGLDNGAEGMEVTCYVSIRDSATVIAKLEVICDRLRQLVFGGARIELMGIDTIDGRSVAQINLVEDSIGRPWSYNLFQGSTGGGATTISLRRGFLQDSYRGSWVNGVQFHLNGEPIQDAWDHIFLSGIFYRKDAARPGDRVPYGDR